MPRQVTCALTAALTLVAAGATGATAATPLPPCPAATTKVASGTWDGVAWTLFAGEFVSAKFFGHSIDVVLKPDAVPNGGGGCSIGGLFKPGELVPTSPPAPGLSYGMNFQASSDCPAFAVFAGIAVAAAREVAITLSTGKTVTTSTIASPSGFAQSLRFWATAIPCGASPTTLVGRDAAGRIVARMDLRFVPHIG